MPAHRLLWTETFGPSIPPKGIHVARLCNEPRCVRPDHQRLQNPKRAWKALRRDVREIALAKLYLEMHEVHGLRWSKGDWSLDPQSLTYAAGHLKLDMLAVIAAWSELAEPENEPMPETPKFDLEQTARVLAEDIAQRNQGGPLDGGNP